MGLLLLKVMEEADTRALPDDSIMVAIMDPGQKTATLLSIPRDSWVPLLLNGRRPDV